MMHSIRPVEGKQKKPLSHPKSMNLQDTFLVLKYGTICLFCRMHIQFLNNLIIFNK